MEIKKITLKSVLFLTLLSILFSSKLNAQLIGGTTYAINGTSNPPTSFATVAEAFAFLNTNGTSGSGNVVLEIS
ncbi:MAG: hypothetical protein ACOVP1_06470, partial [Bacteroidia bacterium]